MNNPKQINQGGAANQEKQPPQQTGSNADPRPSEDFPTDGPEAERRRRQISEKDKAEGERRD